MKVTPTQEFCHLLRINGFWKMFKAILCHPFHPIRIVENQTFDGKPLITDGRPTIVRKCHFKNSGIVERQRS